MNQDAPSSPTRRILLVGVFDNETKAQHAVEKLIERGFPTDQLSLLGQVHASGDDVLGIYHEKAGERMKVWAKQGALWGGLWGLLAGAAGVFFLPPIGLVLAAGPLAEAIIGAVEGAAIASAAMTGAAAVTHLTSALHRIGIPEEKLHLLHQAIEDGHYVVVLHERSGNADQWRPLLGWNASELMELPYTGITEWITPRE